MKALPTFRKSISESPPSMLLSANEFTEVEFSTNYASKLVTVKFDDRLSSNQVV